MKLLEITNDEMVRYITFLIISIGVFFLMRMVMMWYWKINDHLKNQESIIEELKKINESLGKR